MEWRMSEIKKLLIFGTGTLGELAGYYFRSDTTYELQGYVDDAEFAGNKLHFSGKPYGHGRMHAQGIRPKILNILLLLVIEKQILFGRIAMSK
jgi:hypothetical protein